MYSRRGVGIADMKQGQFQNYAVPDRDPYLLTRLCTTRCEHDRCALGNGALSAWHRSCSLPLRRTFRGITKENQHSMHTGTTSVRARASRREFRPPAIFVRAGLAAAIACAPVTGALAQGMQGSSQNDNQERQTAGQRAPTPRRLLVPLTGTLQTAAPPRGVEGNTSPTDIPTPTALEDTAVPTVTGTFSVQRFVPTTDGRAAAVGTMTLSFLDPQSNTARVVITQGAMPLAAAGDLATPGDQTQVRQPGVAQGCDRLRLVLGRVDVDLPGQPIQLDDVNLEFLQGFDRLEADQLCQLAGLIGQAASPSELVRRLNAFLDTIG